MSPYLTPWRWAAALLLIALVGVPLGLPLAELTRHGAAAWSGTHWQLFPHLLGQTLLLVGGTLLLALPLGVLLAILLFRTQFPCRHVLVFAATVMLFVPLPMVTSAWQAFFGSDGWLSLSLWGPNAGRPWATGLLPAIWVHALAGLPWVILFVGLGLTWVEREWEEEGLLVGPPWWVLVRMTLPRCRGAIIFAGIWLALQTAGEISVTDMMLVATFAEEVQTQFTMGDRDALARAVLASLPMVLATWALLAWYLPRLEQKLAPLQMRFAEPRRFSWGRWRWPIGVGCAGTLLLVFGVPIASLVWKLGRAGTPMHWRALEAWTHFRDAFQLHFDLLWQNLLLVACAGASCAVLALVLCWLAEESVWLRRLLIAVLAWAWVLPAPVIGIGMKATIAALVEWFPDGLAAQALYYGPSAVPLLWAHLIRFLPFAVAVLWPVVRLVPREPREAARLEGQGPWREFGTVVWPLTRRGVFLTCILVAALSAGEVAASARVETPGWESYAKLLFDRMHYGVDNNVAALSLVLLAWIVAVLLTGSMVRTVYLLALRMNHRSENRFNDILRAATPPALLPPRSGQPLR